MSKVFLFFYKFPLYVALVYALILRVCFLLVYKIPSLEPDSNAYRQLAGYLIRLDLTNYTGKRTPGFPTLLALAYNNSTIAILYQIIIGLITVYFIYDFCKMRTKNIKLSFWITIFVSSFLHLILYEFVVLTETLSLFLVVFTFWFIEKFDLLNSKTHYKYYILLSFLIGVLYLTRPLFLYFSLGFALYYFVKNFYSKKLQIAIKSCIVLIVPFICFYSWCSLNKSNIGYFTTTSYFGINLTQTATSFFEKAPEEEKLLRDIFIKHRTIVEQDKTKNYAMTVWYAQKEMLDKTGLKPHELSYKLGEISKDLFKKHPRLYFKQVLISWRMFWESSESIVYKESHVSNSFIRNSLKFIWFNFQQYLLILTNILFLIFSAKKIVSFFKNKMKVFDFDLFLVLIVLSGSIAQALVTYGNNSRFSFPYLVLIVYFVVTQIANLNYFKKKYAKNS